MPFGNMDSDKIEARKGLLETFLKVEACFATLRLLFCPVCVFFLYWHVHKAPLIHSLQQLCAIPEIANSEEMQEFLALNTDARIAFVKKPFIVSRIDKVRFQQNSVFLSRGLQMDDGLWEGASFWYTFFFFFYNVQIVVNAIVDTLKTAFPRSEPQSPTEDNEAEVDGGKLSTDKKSRYVCRDPIILLTNLPNKRKQKLPPVLWLFSPSVAFFILLTLFSFQWLCLCSTSVRLTCSHSNNAKKKKWVIAAK